MRTPGNALTKWWARLTLGRDDGVSPHVYEQEVMGAGDTEGTWSTTSRAEARQQPMISEVTLRYPFWPEVLEELSLYKQLEMLTFDAEGTALGAEALAAVRVPLPRPYRQLRVTVLGYVGQEKPAFLAAHPPEAIQWLDCPHIPESKPRPKWPPAPSTPL